MKNCIFIVPYFGKLPSYFPLFLKSCEPNKNFDWLIVTNDKTRYKYPKNVHVMYMSFENFKKKIQSKFSFKICLKQYQKLCDYKPSYGYIFEDEIKKYKFWGYCDIDVILGDLSDFLTQDILDKYDKIFELGHCTLIRNSHETNRLFMKKLNGVEEYKKSFSTDEITIFDEVYGNTPNVNDIFEAYNKKIYGKNYAFDIQTDRIFFQDSGFDYQNQKFNRERDFHKKVCIWDNGKIFRVFKQNGKLRRKEYLYVHLQDRIINWTEDSLYANKLLIIPNYIMPLKHEITYRSFYKIKRFNIDKDFLNFAFNLTKERIYGLKYKFKKLIK